MSSTLHPSDGFHLAHRFFREVPPRMPPPKTLATKLYHYLNFFLFTPQLILEYSKWTV